MGSIHGPILRTLLTRPRRTLIVDDKRSYRGIELLVASLHAAGAIKPRCESPTVGILLPTSGAFAFCAIGAWMLGKVVVPLNFLLKPEELQYVIDDSGMDTILTAGPMLDFLGHTPKVKNLIRVDELDFKGVPEPIWPHSPDPTDLGVLLYTSGTSGKPKGVMLTHGNVRSNIEQCLAWVDINQDDVALGILPQFHAFGLTVLTLLPLYLGMKSVYIARFDRRRVLVALREHRPTLLVAIPSMYGVMLTAKEATPEDFASLRFIVSGGEPLPEAVFRGFQEKFQVTINEGYGLTETSPCTNWCRPGEWRPHSVGMALPGIVQRIVDPATGRTLGKNSDGEVQMRGPNVMQGYYRLAEETAKAFTPDGFFRTGDIGRHDDDGHLYITGRLKEMLIVGGENVFPREIEEVLAQHPAVGGCGVVGMHDDLRGELPIAFAELKEGEHASEQDLLAWCRDRLAGYKVPKHVRVIEKLPRNPTGKVMRRELKKLV